MAFRRLCPAGRAPAPEYGHAGAGSGGLEAVDDFPARAWRRRACVRPRRAVRGVCEERAGAFFGRSLVLAV